MNYLPSGIRARPTRIFEGHPDSNFEKEIVPDASDSVGTARYLKRLRWRPALLAGVAKHMSDAALLSLLAAPQHAFDLVEANSSFFPRVKPLLMQSEEVIEQLHWLSAARKGVEGLNADELRASIADSPNLILRVLDDRGQWLIADKAIADSVAARRTDTPQWSLAYLSRTPLEPEDALDAEVIASLQKSEAAAFSAMRILRGRAFDPEVWAPLEASIVSPRWAFHAIDDGLDCNDPVRLRRLLESDPAWLVEYMVEKEFEIDQARSAFERCVVTAYAHELMPDFQYWMRTVSALSRV